MYYQSGHKIPKNALEGAVGSRLMLRGRVLRIRDKGQLVWLDIMHEGQIFQAFCNDSNRDVLIQAKKITSESVVVLKGILAKKPEANNTSAYELVVDTIEYLSISDALPYNPHFDNAAESIQQQYRFLTLRNATYYKNLKQRSKITNFVRNYLSTADFLEIETPTLVKSTPEGARDFLVPSRVNTGTFYALPQSPQLYKQVLMQSGFEKYFQIARCYRDEALRGDRQLEFTQIDIEASFYGQKEMRTLIIGMIKELFKVMDEELVWNNEYYLTPHISYNSAMSCYGTDKPDLRFGLELQYTKHGIYLAVEKVMTGKERNNIFDWTRTFMSTMRFDVPLSIYTSGNEERLHLENSEIYYKLNNTSYTIFFLNDEKVWSQDGSLIYSNSTLKLAGELRNYIGRNFLMKDKTPHAGCWVTHFPMFEKSEEEGRYVSMHHPFTRPSNEKEFKESPYTCNADAYDLVIDGVEVGGGSVRIHEPELQKKVFELLGLTDYGDKFGGLLEAYKYGAAPHAGLALGLDRLCTFFGESKKIGDYIAFPKNMHGYEAMFGCPSTVEEKQLEELNIKISKNGNN